MSIQGLRTTSNFVTDQRPKNWREGVMLLYPNGKAPLTALTSVMKESSTDDPEFNWWDKELKSFRVALSASITASASNTNISVTSGAKQFKKGDVLWSEQTGEVMRVSQDPTSDTALVVERGVAGSTKTAITYNGAGVNPNLLGIGSAMKEGSNAPTGINFDPTKRYNYTQIFRHTLEMTRTAQKTRLRTGDQVKEAKRECLEMHSIAMERAFWFGQRYETTEDGLPLRYTGGVTSFIDSDNIKTATTDYGSGVTMEGLEEYLYEMFRYGSSEKVGFCGNRALLTIQRVVRKNTTWQIMSGIKEFGMNVHRLICPFGELVLKTMPLWNQIQGGTTGGTDYYGLESWLAVLDMDNFKYRYIDDTRYEKDLTPTGFDGKKAGYIAEVGLEVHHPKTHYLIKELVAAAVDA